MTNKESARRPRRATVQDPNAGPKLRQFRIQRGVTQGQLAEVMGYTTHVGVTHIESGYRSMSREQVERAAEFLGVEPGDISPVVAAGPRTQNEAEVDRFWKKVDRTDSCWNWTGALRADGYGRFRTRDRLVSAHRFAYESVHAPIPEGKEIDHICYNRGCVNPAHLRLVTRKQNQENRSGPQANSASGYRGVTWVPASKKWSASVGHNRKLIRLGLFATAQEAAAAAQALRNELFTHNDADRKSA